MNVLDDLRSNRRGSYAKILSRRGSSMDFKLNKEDKDSSPSRSPLANSTSALSQSNNSSLSNSPNTSGPHSPIGSIPKNFRAIQGIEFAGITVPEEVLPPPNTKAPFSGIPVFLGPDGTLYDVNYIPVTSFVPKFAANDPRSKCTFTPGAPVYSTFPEVDSFENFFDYEQAVMDWKDSVLSHLGWLQLPTALGRTYSRPRMSQESRERRDSTASSDSSFQDLIEDRTTVMGSSVESPPSAENRLNDAFDFVPSPLHDNLLDRATRTDSDGDEFGQDSPITRERTEIVIEVPHDSPNNSGTEDFPKSPRHVFRKSQSFSRGSQSPHRKLSHRLSDPGDLRAQMLEGFEENRWTYSRDPWESTLIPPEPQASFYATYEEYELAMKRWAKECAIKSNFIPPHALQLQDVIKLTPAVEQNERLNSVTEQGPVKAAQDLPVWKVRSGEIQHKNLYPPLPLRPKAPVAVLPTTPINSPPPNPFEVKSPKPLAPSSLRKLNECFDSLGLHIDQEKLVRRFDILPNFTPNWQQSYQAKKTNHLIPDLPLRAIRRTDIFGELDMSPLIKDYPDPEIALNLPKLMPSRVISERDRLENVKEAVKSVKQLELAFRHDHLMSNLAHHGNTPKDLQQHKTEVNNWVAQGQITFDVVKRIFMGRMFVDKFKDFLAESNVPNYFDSTQTFLHVFMDLLNGETFRTILDLFEYSKDDLVLGKVSAFINAVLSVPKGHTWVALIIENYVDHEDLEALYKFALAANFLNTTPIDIFPSRPSLFEPIVKKVFKNESVKTIIEQIHMCYYLGLIAGFSTHRDIKEWLESKRKEVTEALAENLQKDKNFLFINLYMGLCHRSSTLSGLFLFTTIQLLHNYDVTIQKLLRSPDSGLVGNVKNLAASKFIHTQYAARRLFAILLEDPWRDFFFTETDKAKTFFEDLTAASIGNNPALLGTLTLSMVDVTLLNLPTNKEQLKTYPGAFMLSDNIFHKALNHITKAKTLDSSIERVTEYLEKISKTLYTHNLLEASDKLKQTTTKNTKTDAKHENVQITLADIQQIVTFIFKLTGNDEHTMRDNMLNCLRHLLLHGRTFDLLKKETHIHLKLVVFCKDGRNYNFNKTAWKLFYQLIHHHKEALDQFEKSKVLAQLLESIGPNSGPYWYTIMLNSTQYTYKIFSLLDREVDRIKVGKTPSRGGDLKSLEKDLKTLSKIFVNSHLFIKIHMIYKKLLGQPQGAAFIQLALLYYVIGKNQLFKKLNRDIQRNPEYRDGLNKLISMFEYIQGTPFAPTPLANATMLGSSSSSLFELVNHQNK